MQHKPKKHNTGKGLARSVIDYRRSLAPGETPLESFATRFAEFALLTGVFGAALVVLLFETGA